MRFPTLGKALIAIGGVIMFYALVAMPIALPGADMVNIHLLSERQNTLVLGGLLFIAGILLFAVFKLKQTKEEAALEEADAQAKIQTQKKIAEHTRQSLQGMARKIQSKIVEGWRDHGVARLISGVFVGLCVWTTMPYQESSLLDFAALIPLALAFRSCPARTAVIQMHLLNLAFSSLMLTVVHRNDLTLLFIFVSTALFVAYARWKLKPIQKPSTSA